MDVGWLDLVSAPVLILDDTTWQVLQANLAGRRIFGLSASADEEAGSLASLVGKPAVDVIESFIAALPPDGSRNALYIKALTRSGRKALVLHFNRMETGRSYWVVTIDDLAPFFDTFSPDHAEHTFRSVIQSLPIGIEIYDSSLRGLFYNAQSDAWFMYGNYADSELREWWEPAFPDADDRAAATAEWDRMLARARNTPGESQSVEWRVLCSDAIFRLIRFQLSLSGDHYTLIFWDVSEQRRLETSLRKLASTDTLTGVFNRRHFFDQAAAMLRQAQDAGRPVSILMIDVDHFKAVNDQFGHRGGDQVLVTVADRCKSALRENDLLARIGGEEFVVLLPATAHVDAREIAARLHRAMSASPIAVQAGSLQLTVSIGVSSSGSETSSIDLLIDRADAALYAAKHMGRNRIVSSGEFGSD